MGEALVPIVLLIAFAFFWVFMGSVMGVFAGWFALRDAYPRTDERALRTLHFASGALGGGVTYSSCLTLSACPSGLRVAVWPIFGPFNGQFQPPWSEITVSAARFPFVGVKLSFGRPEVGRLWISARAWEKLQSARQAVA